MDVFNNYYHNHTHAHAHAQSHVHAQPMTHVHAQPNLNLQQQQYYNMPYYYPNEVLYPDYTTFAQPNDFKSPYQVYNLEKPVENTDFFLYAPDGPQYPEINDEEEEDGEENNPDIEEILRTNVEVWNAYQTGKFRVNVVNSENGQKKIILKEKGRNEYDKSEYVIRRFKVLVHTPRNSRMKDDHVLLVSFSQKSLPLTANKDNQIATLVEKTNQRLDLESSLKRSNQNLMKFDRSASQILTGPGSELINKIVNGEEDSFEVIEGNSQGVYEEGEYEPAYEIQTSPSKTSSAMRYQDQSKSSESRSSTSSSSHSSTSSSESEQNYIDDIINKIKSSGHPHQSPIDGSRISQGSSHRSVYSNTPHSIHSPFSQNVPADVHSLGGNATPVSVSYIGGARYRNEQSKGSNSVIHYNEGQAEYIAEAESIGNVSRSSTRNANSVHEGQHDTHSIGPGSMAGGSLFGGYIPNHVEMNTEKSAFSEYNLTKNEDGDYVLREANGKSEIFDGKSGLSLGKTNGSRSQLSGNSRSNLSKFDDKSGRSSRVKI